MAQVDRPPTKPNLLFIFTDQQRFDTMRCYGNHLIQTPNLNAVANNSFVFQNAYGTKPAGCDYAPAIGRLSPVWIAPWRQFSKR